MMTLSPSLTVLICPLPSSAVEYWSSLFLVRKQPCLRYFVQSDIKEYSSMKWKTFTVTHLQWKPGCRYEPGDWCDGITYAVAGVMEFLTNSSFFVLKAEMWGLYFCSIFQPTCLFGFRCKFLSVNVLFAHFTNWEASYILITTTGQRYRHSNTVLIGANHALS